MAEGTAAPSACIAINMFDFLEVFTQLFPISFQLTRPMRGATDRDICRKFRASISTHTPHAGRDRNIWFI